MQTTTLQIDGMSCEHCVRAVREALEDVHGAEVQEVAIGRATVRHDEEQAPRERLEAAVAEAGYTSTAR